MGAFMIAEHSTAAVQVDQKFIAQAKNEIVSRCFFDSDTLLPTGNNLINTGGLNVSWHRTATSRPSWDG